LQLYAFLLKHLLIYLFEVGLVLVAKQQVVVFPVHEAVKGVISNQDLLGDWRTVLLDVREMRSILEVIRQQEVRLGLVVEDSVMLFLVK
jgi:hypothetical protein